MAIRVKQKKRRLGCMCCPLAYYKKRIEQFKLYPNMVKAYLRAGERFRQSHPDSKTANKYGSVYEWFVRYVFYKNQESFEESKKSLFENQDYKSHLEDFFNIKL